MRSPGRDHLAVLVVIGTLAALALILAARGHGEHRPPTQQHRRVLGYGQVRFDGAGPERWAARFRRARDELVVLQRRLAKEQRVLLSRPDVVEAINLAAATYGNGPTLWRKARCETGGTFDPHATNPSGADGLFQFIDSTWRSTPYARFSVWSPYASALAAGWMHQQGRGKEWSCR